MGHLEKFRSIVTAFPFSSLTALALFRIKAGEYAVLLQNLHKCTPLEKFSISLSHLPTHVLRWKMITFDRLVKLTIFGGSSKIYVMANLQVPSLSDLSLSISTYQLHPIKMRLSGLKIQQKVF